MRPQLRLSAGGTVTLRPPEDRRPSAASAALYSPQGTLLQAALTTAIDAVNTTLSTEATAGGGSVVLTSVTGVSVGEYYRLADSLGRVESVRAVSVDPSTKAVQVMHPLRQAYPSAATFEGTRLTATIAGADVATLDEGYEVRWTYTIGGVDYQAIQLVDVVRSPWPAQIVTAADLDRGGPGRHLAPNVREEVLFGDQVRKAEQRVREDIKSRGRRPDLFRGFSEFVTVVLEALDLERVRQGNSVPGSWQNDPATYLQIRTRDYERALSQALQNTRDYDANGDGVVSSGERTARIQTVELSL